LTINLKILSYRNNFNSHHKNCWYCYDKIEGMHQNIVDVAFW
jgi:hypothetical protein